MGLICSCSEDCETGVNVKNWRELHVHEMIKWNNMSEPQVTWASGTDIFSQL